VAVATGTSPAIAAADPGITFQIAVRRAADGHLVLISDGGAVRDTGVPVLTGTSPAIAAAAGGFEADVQTPARDMVTVLGSGPGRSTSVIMAAGTSPAAAVTFPAFSTVPSVLSVDQDIAEGRITDAGLTVGAIALDSTCKDIKGAVLTQNPVHDSTVAPGTPVNLTVSTGEDAHHNPCVIK
jgi:serine/threonine-protein kinase